MASQLPTIPFIVFTVVEPFSLLAGCIPALIQPDWFIKQQLPVASAAVVSSDNARLVAQQLGNAYGLLFMLGVAVLYTSTEISVVRNYLVALLIADLGHVWVTYRVLGYDSFMDFGQWNAMTWGNIGATACLCFTRIAYLMGWFGPDLPAPKASKKAA